MTPETFLAELKAYDIEKFLIVTSLRTIILNSNAHVTEVFKYGGLLYSSKKPFAGIFVSKNHISIEFSEGAKLADPKNKLLGIGKYRRHLKFKTAGEIHKHEIQTFLKEAVKIANAY